MSVLIVELERCKEGACRSSGRFDPAELGFEDSQELRFDGFMELDVRINSTDRLTYYVHGHVYYRAEAECRRCLKLVSRERNVELRGVYAFAEGLEKMDLDEDDPDVECIFQIAGDRKDIDLTDLVREGVLLDYPRFLECSEQCKGLCPTCGVDLNEQTCDCRSSVRDIRWQKLRELGEKD